MCLINLPTVPVCCAQMKVMPEGRALYLVVPVRVQAHQSGLGGGEGRESACNRQGRMMIVMAT